LRDKVRDFSAAFEGARHLPEVDAKMLQKQRKVPAAPDRMNVKLREAERALLIPEGLPNRPWFHEVIYAPGQYTGYAAVVTPGVNEAIDQGDLRRTQQQSAALAAALNRAVLVLEQYR
jgi:N-acetylated-alpha-linked acidic dipeptidase